MTRAAGHISTARIERALRIVARLVAAPGGEEFVPIFERVEAELAQRRRAEDVRARARALLRATAGDGLTTRD